jgi:hypothetical protein
VFNKDSRILKGDIWLIHNFIKIKFK